MDVLLSLTQTDEVFLVSARDHVTGKVNSPSRAALSLSVKICIS